MNRLKVDRLRLASRPVSLAILSLGLLVMALIGLDRFVATAQTTAQPKPTETSETTERFVTDTITVTATKTKRERITTPGEVNVIDRDELDRTQANSLEDVLRYQPGVDVQLGPRRVGELPVIRGLSGARVLTTIDGVRLNFQSAHQGRLFLDVDSLKQIEVVRGPNSALWGSGALGGVLALTTKDPADYLEDPNARYGGALKLGFQGAYEEFVASPTLFGRLDDTMEYLFTFTFRDSDDINLGGDAGTLDNSAEKLYSGLGKVVWSLSPHDQLKLSIQGFDELGDVPLNPSSDVSPTNPVVDRTTRQFTYRLGYTHRNPANPSVDFEGFLYLTELEVRERRLSDDRLDKIDFDTMGLEFRNSTQLDFGRNHQHLVTYGVEGYIDRQDASRAGGVFQQFPDGKTKSIAAYIQDEINLWDRLFIIPALRWDRFEQTADDQPDSTESEFSPKIGGAVKVIDSVYVAANYAEGFRAPTFSELFIGGTHFPGSVFVPNPDLKPEKSKNVDVSVRIQRDRLFFADDRFRASGTYFRNKLDDFIDFETNFNPFTQQLEFRQINVREATIKGWEAELLWAFYPGFELIANYTDIRGDNDTDDQPLADIPPRKGVIGLSYTHIPWYLTVGGRVQIVDDQNRVPEGVSRTGGYTLYDIFAQWEPEAGLLEGLRIDFGIDNLTDKEYRRHLSPLPEAGINPKVAISYVRNW